MENIFNSRNWYGGELGWPQLGEVEGAARPWSDGTGCCNPAEGVFGTEDQWKSGSLLADALDSPPCAGPEILGFPLVNVVGNIQGDIVNFVVQPFPLPCYGDLAFVGFPGYFLTLLPQAGGACCFAHSSVIAITSGPPLFTVLSPSPAGEIVLLDDPANNCYFQYFLWYANGSIFPYNCDVQITA
jgi:hypothetical protein